jgi:chloride channel protein, CIC family
MAVEPETMPLAGGEPDRPGHAPAAPRAAEIPRIGLVYLSLLALLVGIVGGIGAVLFRDLIGLVHNLLFLGSLSWRYDANLFTPSSPWGPLVILVPVVGAVAVTFLVTTFAPEARGHGVPRRKDIVGVRTKEQVADSVANSIKIYPA